MAETRDEHLIPLVTQDDVDAQNAADAAESQYELVRELAGETHLFRRRADGTLFLGSPLNFEETAPKLDTLLKRGANQAVTALLSHPNLVSYIDTIKTGVVRERTTKPRMFSAWDYCDAGSLETLLRKSTRPVQTSSDTGQVRGWLPESLCWHVVISLLSALAWLHEGHVEVDVVEDLGTTPRRSTRDYTAADREQEDWMPILHRNVMPSNVFFQQPRGIETYGLCKLGNYSRVFVSGHVNGRSRGQVVCSLDDESSMAEVQSVMAVDDLYKIDKSKRPYFRGTEVFWVGAILYEMMTKQELPDKEECTVFGCGGRHWVDQSTWPQCVFSKDGRVFDLEEKTEPLIGVYTRQLVLCLRDLLQAYRADAHAPSLLRDAKAGYMKWRTGTAAGATYRDLWDDMVLRQQNKKRRDDEQSAIAHAQSGPNAVDVVKLAMDTQDAVAAAVSGANDDASDIDDAENGVWAARLENLRT
ncbi:hypothetical protein M406DRAFT_75931 [Cryphonectria parasitica EP155]|uniref:non-specific serine/threonine protein kinase n=1 Tax=Cryphonectria parasitica (strain ATCC 38755 / EP155) TaxID=660469 RepID=A0A9P5CKK3_CRYP1|nr:uncharacterized protein M406DRAFT_75931 [Cryphonectria parasitica EP155]KAF3761252.1 hypothetical protein M406DRAFT_75931 [Cryphonectria parasitica EP155]